ncbi:MAG TPA: pyridoxal-dependent decarboxylase [Gemmatirosa sp.]
MCHAAALTPFSPLPPLPGDDTLAAILDDAAADAAAPFTALAAAYFAEAGAGLGRVTSGRSPDELAARFDEPLPRAARPLADVAARLARDVVADANRLTHPMSLGHQVAAPLPAAVWAEPVIAALNQSVAVQEMSPTGTPVERQVIRWMSDLAGFGPRAGGTFTSGGTEATFAALLAARSRALPNVWTDGLGAVPPVIVCGDHAHYAVTRAAGEMGLGLRNVVQVPSRDARGGDFRMNTAALATKLADLAMSGRRVMAVVATAGSTATGSFDDLTATADACAAHDHWLHVDGAHGASALLSGTHRHRLRGLDRAHSLAWDPHKMLLLPLAAGVVLVRDERWLDGAFAQAAPYLFQDTPEAHAEEFDAGATGGGPPRGWDQGVRTFQCSRRADALKLWVAFQRYGADGLGALYDRLCALAARLYARLAAHPAFDVWHEPESNILCFSRRASSFAGTAQPATSPAGGGWLDAANAAVRAHYNASGAGWITTTVLGGRGCCASR